MKRIALPLKHSWATDFDRSPQHLPLLEALAAPRDGPVEEAAARDPVLPVLRENREIGPEAQVLSEAEPTSEEEALARAHALEKARIVVLVRRVGKKLVGTGTRRETVREGVDVTTTTTQKVRRMVAPNPPEAQKAKVVEAAVMANATKLYASTSIVVHAVLVTNAATCIPRTPLLLEKPNLKMAIPVRNDPKALNLRR